MGCSWIFKRNYEFTKNQCKRGDKFARMFRLLNRWLELIEDRKAITNYLEKMNYSNIAIYGVGTLGKHLVRELNCSAIKIDYIIDKKVEIIEEDIMIYKPDDSFPNTDAVIITAIMEFDNIADELEPKVNCPIISLEDIIFDM